MLVLTIAEFIVVRHVLWDKAKYSHVMQLAHQHNFHTLCKFSWRLHSVGSQLWLPDQRHPDGRREFLSWHVETLSSHWNHIPMTVPAICILETKSSRKSSTISYEATQCTQIPLIRTTWDRAQHNSRNRPYLGTHGNIVLLYMHNVVPHSDQRWMQVICISVMVVIVMAHRSEAAQ